MELLDRYLQAVGFWLPKSQRQDIIAELSEDLRSQIEEKEGELGRSLDGPELEHLLKQRGAPLLVAERYLPQRHLIGPWLFPIYALVLRSAVTYYLLPWLLVWLGFLVFDPAYRAASPGVAIVGTLKGLWLMAVYGFAFTTAAFALLEQCQANARFLETWDPRRLPPVRNPSQMPRGNQVAELTWNMVLILWWTGVLHLPEIPGLRIRPAPGIERFYWPVMALLAALIAIAAVNVARPWWTARRAAIRLAIDSSGLVLVIVLLMARPWVEAAPPATRNVAEWLNWTVLPVLVLYALSFLLRSIQDLRRAMAKAPLNHWAIRLLIGE